MAEHDQETVTTSNGLATLSGRSREAVRKEEKEANYTQFRGIWDEVHEDVLGLIPAKGTLLGEMQLPLGMALTSVP